MRRSPMACASQMIASAWKSIPSRIGRLCWWWSCWSRTSRIQASSVTWMKKVFGCGTEGRGLGWRSSIWRRASSRWARASSQPKSGTGRDRDFLRQAPSEIHSSRVQGNKCGITIRSTFGYSLSEGPSVPLLVNPTKGELTLGQRFGIGN